MKNDIIDKLFVEEDKNLQKLHKIVKEAIDAEELILHNLSNPETETLNFGQNLADRVALFGGSWKFIII